MRQRRDFIALAMTLNCAILIAGICFLLVPAQVAYAPPTDFGLVPSLYHFADKLSLTYNLAPSLHVTLSVICIAAFAERAGPSARICFWIWATAIALSTLLIHKHHVLDVATGLGLAWFLMRTVHAPASGTIAV